MVDAEKRRLQNRKAQRKHREKLKRLRDPRMNPEPGSHPRRTTSVSKQQSYGNSNEETDVTTSQIDTSSFDPAPTSSPNFTSSPFEVTSSQMDSTSQDQPTTASMRKLNHATHDFLPDAVPNTPNHGTESWVFEQPFGNSSAPENLFDIDPMQGNLALPQIVSPYALEAKNYHSSRPLAPRRSNEPLSGLLHSMIASKNAVDMAKIHLEQERIKLSVEESNFSVEMELLRLKCAELG